MTSSSTFNKSIFHQCVKNNCGRTSKLISWGEGWPGSGDILIDGAVIWDRRSRTLKVGIGDGVSMRGFFAAAGEFLLAADDEHAS
jgi:hypothetical protein